MAETYTLWVCGNCLMHLANGECGDCHREEGHEGGEPLSLVSNHASPGTASEEHAEDCLTNVMARIGERAEDGGYECDCETNTFSTSTCQGCGSIYHGERHAITEWSE